MILPPFTVVQTLQGVYIAIQQTFLFAIIRLTKSCSGYPDTYYDSPFMAANCFS